MADIIFKELFCDMLRLQGEAYYQDVTLIFSDGSLHCNIFLLASMFPALNNLLSSSFAFQSCQDGDAVISIPDMEKQCLESVFQQKRKEMLPINLEKYSFFQNNLSTKSKEEINSTNAWHEEGNLDVKLEQYSSIEDDAMIGIITEDYHEAEENDEHISTKLETGDHSEDFKVTKIAFMKEKTKEKKGYVGTNDGETQPQQEKSKNTDAKVECPKCHMLLKLNGYKPQSAVNIHLKSCGRNNKFRCVLCSKDGLQLQNAQMFQEHMKSVHPVDDQNKMSCPMCGKKYKYKKLTMHCLRIHYQPENYIKCRICTNIRRFDKIVEHEEKCSQLKNQEESIPCNICGKVYKSTTILKAHIEYTHKKKGEKTIPCTMCDMKFHTPSEKSKHMKKTHVDKTPCPECGKLVKDLKNHKLISHTPDSEKPFQCDKCDRGFNHTWSLETHKMNVHLKTRPYKCRYGCSFAYNDMSNRNAHEKKTHGKIFLNKLEEREKSKIYIDD